MSSAGTNPVNPVVDVNEYETLVPMVINSYLIYPSSTVKIIKSAFAITHNLSKIALTMEVHEADSTTNGDDSDTAEYYSDLHNSETKVCIRILNHCL